MRLVGPTNRLHINNFHFKCQCTPRQRVIKVHLDLIPFHTANDARQLTLTRIRE